MLIACEKCATTYVLDERLIPAAGAPVQCTRCGHVFTARPGAAADPAALSDTPHPRSTMAFGKPAEKPPNTTIVFGTPGAPAAPPAVAPAPNRTMIFGAAGAEAPGATGAPKNTTMMFGAAGAEPPGAKGAPKSTMMFGAAGAEPPGAKGGPKSTMMFGAAEAEPPGAKAAPRNTTMMFGAAGAEPPGAKAAPKNTMMFGAAEAGPPGAKAAPTNTTMMFGAAGAAASQPASPPSDPMFGAGSGEPSAEPPPNRTVIFGAVAAPPAIAPVPTRPTAQTMVFGAVSRPGAAPVAPAPPAPQANRTMMFGIPAERPNVGPAAAPGSMTFGIPAPGAKLSEQTVRIGPEDLERMMREHHGTGERGGERTPPETAPAGTSQKTQMFAMSDIRPPGEATPADGSLAATPADGSLAATPADGSLATTPADGRAAVESSEQAQRRHDRTAMFAMSPEGPSAQERSNIRFDPSLLETLPPDQQPLPVSLPPPEQITNPDLLGTTLPNLPDLPRTKLPARPSLERAPKTDPAGVDDPAQVLLGQTRRRNRLALIILGVALLGVAGAVGWKLFGARLLAAKVPLEAMQRVETGLAELRNDDTASKAAAVKTLLAVVKDQPGFVDAHAGLVTALTLQLDDLQQRAKRLDKAAEERNARIIRYGKEKSPADWDTRAAALVAEVGAIKQDYDPLVAEAQKLEARLREAYKAMQVAAGQGGELSGEAKLSLIRAQALYHAYGGTDEALKLTKRYQTISDGKSDGWIDLVDAEYAANTRASPDLIAGAQKQLAELRKRDSSFFRTYILAARLHLQAKHYDEAEAELANVSALKPKHDIANELTQWVAKVKLEQQAKDKERLPP